MNDRFGDSHDRYDSDSRVGSFVSSRPREPHIPDEITGRELDRESLSRLRALSKPNAEMVARHIVMAGQLLDDDPETAYEHAQAAVRRAGRIDVAREAAGLTSYATGRYAEALRELRTVRRLNGSSEYIAVMADCERGLGRPERAIELAEGIDPRNLSIEVQVELIIVVSGARLDMSEPEAGLAALSHVPPLDPRSHRELIGRLASARAQILRALGRDAEAESARSHAARLAPDSAQDGDEDDITVFDLEDDFDDNNEADENDAETSTEARADSPVEDAGAGRDGVEEVRDEAEPQVNVEPARESVPEEHSEDLAANTENLEK